MRRLPAVVIAAMLVASPGATLAQTRPTTDAQIDYAAFSALTDSLEDERAAHRLQWDDFAARARASSAILLDARSAAAYQRGHMALTTC